MYSFLRFLNSMSTKRKRLSRKADLVLRQPKLKKLDIFAELELEKI